MIISRLTLFVILLSAGSLFAATPIERPLESPGFWERAWGSTKKTTGKVVDLTKKPFGKSGSSGKKDEPAWNQLQIALKVIPEVVKLPETKTMQVAVVVTNMGKKLVQLEFPTSERIEVVLRGNEGKVLSRWSEDQKVESAPGLVSINPGEYLEYNATLSTRDMEVGGSYQIEAYFPSFDQLRMTKLIVPEK